MVCQHSGQLLSERAEKYEMDEVSGSGESNKSSSRTHKTVNEKMTKLSLNYISCDTSEDFKQSVTKTGRSLAS